MANYKVCQDGQERTPVGVVFWLTREEYELLKEYAKAQDQKLSEVLKEGYSNSLDEACNWENQGKPKR